MLSIGEIIRTTREQQQLSQEELSYGICSTSNLSRIENGEQIPTRATYISLTERLGLTPDIFPSFQSEREVDAFRLKHQINRKIELEQYEEAITLLEKLESIPKLERLYQQFILYSRSILFRKKGVDPKEALEEMKRIASLSVRDISCKNILRQVLTKDDLLMLNSLAVCHYYADEKDEAIELLYALKEYIERKIVDDDGISSMYTVILYNLSKWVGLAGRNKESLKLCDIGIKRCIEYRAYIAFASLLFNKGYALVMLGEKDKAQKYIQEAYYLNRSIGEIKRCEINKKIADENGIPLL
jgi:transcriptional regulator with XRE-family HTH domain